VALGSPESPSKSRSLNATPVKTANKGARRPLTDNGVKC
jgi:hypothetical protein